MGHSDVLLCKSDKWKQQCCQHQAGRTELIFFDVGTDVRLKSLVTEAALL